jgi:hypothetical protein
VPRRCSWRTASRTISSAPWCSTGLRRCNRALPRWPVGRRWSSGFRSPRRAGRRSLSEKSRASRPRAGAGSRSGITFCGRSRQRPTSGAGGGLDYGSPHEAPRRNLTLLRRKGPRAAGGQLSRDMAGRGRSADRSVAGLGGGLHSAGTTPGGHPATCKLIEPMTLCHMRKLDVRSLDLSCRICPHRAVPSADRWPDDVAVPTFGPRMVCTWRLCAGRATGSNSPASTRLGTRVPVGMSGAGPSSTQFSQMP